MDTLKKMTMDVPNWQPSPKEDDFIVAIGKNKSNSIYHIAEVSRISPIKGKRMKRHHMKVYKSDLPTLLMREGTQALYTMKWYPRKKK